MILEGEMMRAGMPVGHGRESASGGRAARRQTAAEKELMQVEAEIAALTRKARALAGELGRSYAVFRSESAGCGQRKDLKSTRLLELSRATDECIDRIYRLDRRRRELMKKIP